jgi:hypothetical protein
MHTRTRRLAIALVLGGTVAGAMPSAASADAATAALGAPITRATANGVITGPNSMTIALECSAISVSPAASTRVSCTAGPASASIALPGPVAEAAGTGSGPLAPFTICATGTTHTILGGDLTSNGCRPSIAGLTAAMVAA